MRYLLIILFFTACIDAKRYCGEITDKGKEEPTSGYKTSRDACYYLIIKVDSINQSIRVNVTVPAWYDAHLGDRVCYTLTELELDWYGNGRKHLIK